MTVIAELLRGGSEGGEETVQIWDRLTGKNIARSAAVDARAVAPPVRSANRCHIPTGQYVTKRRTAASATRYVSNAPRLIKDIAAVSRCTRRRLNSRGIRPESGI